MKPASIFDMLFGEEPDQPAYRQPPRYELKIPIPVYSICPLVKCDCARVVPKDRHMAIVATLSEN